MELRFLSQEDVAACGGGSMSFVLPIVERVLAIHAEGDAIVPSKVVLRWGGVESELTNGRINAMPGYVGGEFAAAGIKWISSFPGNVQLDLPRGVGVLVLNDPRTGVPLALLEGTLISAMRTGAVCGVAARHLAPAGARTAGLVGAGVINRTTLMAFKEAVPELERAFVHDPVAERAERFAHELAAELAIEVEAVASAEDAIRPAQLVATATTSAQPIVRAEWLGERVLYCQTGGNECEPEVIERASVNVVDDWTEVTHRGTQTIARMHAERPFADERLPVELGDVVRGRHPGRTADDGLIVASAIGLGIEDIAVGSRLLAQARSESRGREFGLWERPFAI